MICLAVLLLAYYLFAPPPKQKLQRFYTDEEIESLDVLVGADGDGHSRA